MKRRVFLGIIILTSLSLLAGCSFDWSKFNPLKKKAAKVEETTYGNEKAALIKPREEVIREINGMVDQMVEKLNAGDWQTAIRTGEQAYTLFTKEPALDTSVKEAVYAINTVKEKLFETLAEAYDFKNHLEGLSKEEKEKYTRTARDHYLLNPSEPLKKHALARVLIETGNLTEGLKLATEVYNSPEKNKDITDTYAWGLYLSGQKAEAYEIYKTFYTEAETLIQLFHSAVVIEEQDKSLGLKLYKGCEKAGNNLMVREENLKNLCAQSYTNKIVTDSQKAINRLLAGGSGVDSQYRMDTIQSLIHSVVKL